jgi:hypothetical protein
VEHRRGDDQDRRVDEERRAERDHRVERVVPDRLAAAGLRLLDVARLDERGVEVEIVRHDRRARGCRARCRTPSALGMCGTTRPAARLAHSGWRGTPARRSRGATVLTSVSTIASILRKPKCIAASRSMTSSW